MNVVVMRRQPTVPAWAWMSAVLALLLLFTAVWWANNQSNELREIAVRPSVPDAAQQQTPAAGPDQVVTYGQAPQPKRVVDWSQPSEGFQPPPETVDHQSQTAGSRTIEIVVGKPAQNKAKQEAKLEDAKADETNLEAQEAVPPTPRLASESSALGKFVYGDTTWVLSSTQPVSEEEADLSSAGNSVDGRELYALPGEEDQPSVLFLETSPGSGQYNVYRPVQ